MRNTFDRQQGAIFLAVSHTSVTVVEQLSYVGTIKILPACWVFPGVIVHRCCVIGLGLLIHGSDAIENETGFPRLKLPDARRLPLCPGLFL